MKKICLLYSLLLAFISANTQPPTITSFSPASGTVGTTVTITGTNFSSNPANNIVFFGAVRALVVSASQTSLIVTVPVGATYQPITVTTNNLTAYSAKPFMITFSNSCPGFAANSFSGPNTYQADSDPRNLATVDFDGDGKADIAETGIASNTISVFRNTSVSGTLGLAAKIDFTTGDSPERVATGDFDGDGKSDMAVANGLSGTVSVFRNISTAGTISFAAKTDYATGFNSRGVGVGDFDGDGKPDIVVANTGVSTISFLRNTSTAGAISFAAQVDYATGFAPHAIAIADLDGDNRPDVAVANLASNTVSIFRNTSTSGAISFTTGTDYPLPGTNSYGIAIGDLDGDGKPDLAASSLNANIISIFRNTSTSGNITLASPIAYSTTYFPLNIAIADMDGDGKPDLAMSDFNTYNFTVLQNISTNGTISFGEKTDYGFGVPSTNLVIVDLDGDGRLDVATSAYSINSLTVFKNQVGCPQGCTAPTFLNNGLIVLDASCGKTDGGISIIPLSGTTPFMYSINGGTTYVSGPNAGYTFSSLAAGTYNLRLKDANGCESAVVSREVRAIYGCAVTCVAPTFLNNARIVLDASCGRNDGGITIIPTCGTPPYMYSIDSGATYVAGPDNGFTFTNLAPGRYQLRLKSGTEGESVVIEKTVRSIHGGPLFTHRASSPTCIGINNGSISIVPITGTPPYLYSINNGVSYVAGPDTGYVFTNVAPANYSLKVKDSRGCESEDVLETVGEARSRCPVSPVVFAAQTDAMAISPNPNKGRFTLQLPNIISGKAELSVFDAKGVAIQKRLVVLSKSNTTDFDLTGRAPGLYYIKMVTGSGTKVAKVVIQ